MKKGMPMREAYRKAGVKPEEMDWESLGMDIKTCGKELAIRPQKYVVAPLACKFCLRAMHVASSLKQQTLCVHAYIRAFRVLVLRTQAYRSCRLSLNFDWVLSCCFVLCVCLQGLAEPTATCSGSQGLVACLGLL